MEKWSSSDKKIIMKNKKNEILKGLSPLMEEDNELIYENHWIDHTHNVFAMIAGSGDDRILSVSLELYDYEDFIGDLHTYESNDISMESLEKLVEAAIRDYYGE